jgi:deazaflavin-dependent oxidoreductase (nitroreductase family)
MYIPIDNHLLVIASNAGAPVHPDWYRNLVAHPQVTVEMGAETFDATAEVIEGPEREQL